MSSESTAAARAPAAMNAKASAPADLAIHIRGLGKAYHVFGRPEDRLKQMMLGRWRTYYREFWAVHDLDLDVGRGEVVGIIGRNGSGKSTLLQMICGTLAPTTGTLVVQGRIAALLELGAGFNIDFTGRDNVFLNGRILGVGREEMEKRYDAIAAFADIGEFLDQPVKTYSSGMYARLAFAVAINVDPQILVVDEALSVGDEAFQRKCYARLRQIRDSGATVLLVSHAAGTVVQLCDRAVLLDHGRRLLTADPKTAIAKYQRLAYAPADRIDPIREEILKLDAELAGGASASAGSAAQPTATERAEATTGFRSIADSAAGYFDPNLTPKSTVEYVSRGVSISDAGILDSRSRRVNVLVAGQPYRYRYTVTFETEGFSVRFGMMIKSITGVELAGGASHPEGESIEHIPAGRRLTVTFGFQNLLAPGAYFLNAGVLGATSDGHSWLARVLDVAMFRVDPAPGAVATGLVNLLGPEACQIEPAAELSEVGA
jgi:lipopolysaccharide transport system ATP-binding protein